jgi:hypothetical protein
MFIRQANAIRRCRAVCNKHLVTDESDNEGGGIEMEPTGEEGGGDVLTWITRWKIVEAGMN